MNQRKNCTFFFDEPKRGSTDLAGSLKKKLLRYQGLSRSRTKVILFRNFVFTNIEMYPFFYFFCFSFCFGILRMFNLKLTRYIFFNFEKLTFKKYSSDIFTECGLYVFLLFFAGTKLIEAI